MGRKHDAVQGLRPRSGARQRFAAIDRAHYELALRVHIYPFFGDHDIEDVTPTVVRAFIAQQWNDGIGSGAMNLCYRLLSKIMHAALADELIQRNPLTP